MGWSFGRTTKKALIADLTRGYTNKTTRKCVAHCYRGGRYRGVLWSVWAISDPTTNAVLDSYIGCDVLEYRGGPCGTGEWGYKNLCETSGPSYYSCPPKYLDMVPIPDSKHAPKWREQVLAYHAKRHRKLTKGATYEVTPGLTLDGKKIARIRVDTLSPIRGTVVFESGATVGRVKFKRKMVGEEVIA